MENVLDVFNLCAEEINSESNWWPDSFTADVVDDKLNLYYNNELIITVDENYTTEMIHHDDFDDVLEHLRLQISRSAKLLSK